MFELSNSGWVQLQTLYLTSGNPGTPILIPNVDDFRSFAIVARASSEVLLTVDTGDDVSLITIPGLTPTPIGPFTKGVRLYGWSIFPLSFQITGFGSPDGELGELPFIFPAPVVAAFEPTFIGYHLPADWEVSPLGSAPGLGSRNNRPMLVFTTASADNACWMGVIPPDVPASPNTRFTIMWAAATATSGDVTWRVRVERLAEDGLDLDTDGFSSPQSSTDTAPATAGQLRYSVVSLVNGFSNIQPGEAYRIRVERTGSGPTEMADNAEIYRILVSTY